MSFIEAKVCLKDLQENAMLFVDLFYNVFCLHGGNDNGGVVDGYKMVLLIKEGCND